MGRARSVAIWRRRRLSPAFCALKSTACRIVYKSTAFAFVCYTPRLRSVARATLRELDGSPSRSRSRRLKKISIRGTRRDRCDESSPRTRHNSSLAIIRRRSRARDAFSRRPALALALARSLALALSRSLAASRASAYLPHCALRASWSIVRTFANALAFAPFPPWRAFARARASETFARADA